MKHPGKGSSGVLQVVWRIWYGDEDLERMTRSEIIAAMNSYRLYSRIGNDDSKTQRNMALLVEEDIVDDEEVGDDIHGMFGTPRCLLDRTYRHLDMLAPHPKQNRLN